MIIIYHTDKPFWFFISYAKICFSLVLNNFFRITADTLYRLFALVWCISSSLFFISLSANFCCFLITSDALSNPYYLLTHFISKQR